jgi:predicted unusual protein kinase regulating ubiquinone biosynthesis (AarF/ABC1/UbiB family)
MARTTGRKKPVPATRVGRFARLGIAAGELALGGVAQRIRSIGQDQTEPALELLLNAGSAKKLAGRLAGMRGAVMKMGQVLSMESSNVLPREFADALAILRSDANTMPDSQINRLMGREFGKGWQARFQHFEYEPIAAASIGQVHRVVARDGRELALKIQYPGVAKSIDSDVDNMAMLLKLSRLLPGDFDVSAFIADIKAQLKKEADYILEADHLSHYGMLLRDDPRFVVPAVHRDLSTRRVLAMDFVEGIPLESLGEQGVSQALRDEIGAELQGLVFRELFEFRTMQSDPNFANYLYQPASKRIVLLDFGSTVCFESDFCRSYAGIANALIEQDEESSRRYARQLGYLSAGGSEEYASQIMRIIRMVCEPIHTSGPYDFAASDIFSRARDIGMEMFRQGGVDYVVPPPQTTYLHRKLMGSFLLCARIRANIDVQRIIRPYLPGFTAALA